MFGEIQKPEWAVEGDVAYILGDSSISKPRKVKIVKVTKTQITVESKNYKDETVKVRFQMPKHGTRISEVGTGNTWRGSYLVSEMDGLHELARMEEQDRVRALQGRAMKVGDNLSSRRRWINPNDVRDAIVELQSVLEGFAAIGQEPTEEEPETL